MSSSELHTLQRAFTAAGGKWSTFVIWAKHTFTLGRADYQRQYEPILYGWRDGHDHYWCGARDQGDVWFFDKPARNDLHPTMKPVALVERAIRNSSKSRDIVLDPFGGSGSTLIACEKTGRQARLVELDPRYCDVMIQRWQAWSGAAGDARRRWASVRRDRRRARGRGGVGVEIRTDQSGSVPSWRNRAVLPSGTRPSSSWTLTQSSGTNGSLQASGRSGCQPSRVDPNTPSSLMPTMVRTADAFGSFEVGEGPVEIGLAEALLGEQGPGLGAVGRVEPIAGSLEQVLMSGRALAPSGSVLGLDPVIR